MVTGSGILLFVLYSPFFLPTPSRALPQGRESESKENSKYVV